MLRRVKYLDPREPLDAAQAPISDSANLPLSELPLRLHELPPKHEWISIAAEPELAEKTISFLRERGRLARRVDLSYGISEPSGVGILWSPNAVFEQFVRDAIPGRMLDLGCGTGRDAIFAASEGWKVVAVDRLGDALDRGRYSSERLLGFNAARIEWRHRKIEESFDLVAERGSFDVVTCFFSFGAGVFRAARSALRPGAALLIEAFTPTHQLATGRPRDTAATLGIESANAQLADFEISSISEALRGERHTLRVVARAPK